MGLEEAQLADALRADAAGSEVGNTAGLKFNANVGDIHLAGEDGQADGVERAHRGTNQREHDVEVVNHEVENDVDVERARAENAEAMRLKEHGVIEERASGSDGGIEALEMAGLEDAVVGGSGVDEMGGFGNAGGDGLFNEDVNACLEKSLRYGEMRGGGRANGGGVEGDVAAQTGGETLRERRVDGDGRFSGSSGARWVGLDNSGEMDGCAFLLECLIDAQMVAAKSTGTADENAGMRRTGQGFLPGR